MSDKPQLKAVPTPPAAQPAARHLERGQLLFTEGENSRAMYLLKSGMIRIFKKKGESQIELDTIRSGEVLGELAFLDGNPRSASGEALTECELVEVNGAAFQQVLTQMPEWLKILLKTVVGRLRAASTKIRQLEAASTAVDYSKGKDSKASYVFLSPTDTLKILSGILLIAARNGVELRIGLLNRYASQIMGVPAAKITCVIEVLTTLGVLEQKEEAAGTKITLKDIDYIEKLIAYLNEENLCEPSKRHDIPYRAFSLMGLIVKHLDGFSKDVKTGLTQVNIAAIRAAEQTPEQPDPFRAEDLIHLVKRNYATNINIKSAEEMFTLINADEFRVAHRYQSFAMAITMLNEQKRGGAPGAR